MARRAPAPRPTLPRRPRGRPPVARRPAHPRRLPRPERVHCGPPFPAAGTVFEVTKIRRSCSRRRRERWGPLVSKEASCSGNKPLALCCASGPPRGGRLRVRWTTASVVARDRNLRDRGGPCRSEYRASEWIAGAGPPYVFGAGPAGIFVSGRRLVIFRRIEFER